MLEHRTAPNVSVATIKVKNDRPPDKEASKQLAESIREVGLMHPIVIDREHNLVAGRRRLAAVKLLGWKKIPATVISTPDDYHRELGTIDENLVRSDLTTLERAERLARRQEIYKALGKRGFTPESAKLARVTPRSVQHEVQIAQKISRVAKAAIRGTPNEDSKRDLLALARLPEATQERVARVATERKIPVRQAAHVVKKGDQVAAIKRLTLPRGKFNVVAADPPWSFDDQLDPGRRLDYPVMTTADIEKFDNSWAGEDCVLWLWTTTQHLLRGEAVSVAEAWGFTPRTIYYWAKNKRSNGHWGWNQVEPFLLCTRGKPPLLLENVTNYLFAAVREHSRKPEEFWTLIEGACPGRQRLELFSREHRPGWTVYGDEAGKFNGATP